MVTFRSNMPSSSRNPTAQQSFAYTEKPHTSINTCKFGSNHPLHPKLGVIRTLLDRKNAIVTEEDDKKVREDNTRQALVQCGYPEWAINKVKKKLCRSGRTA